MNQLIKNQQQNLSWGDPANNKQPHLDIHQTRWLLVESYARRYEFLAWKPRIWFGFITKERNALKSKWVYKLKTDENTLQPQHKACLVMKGFSKKKVIDFEIFVFSCDEDIPNQSCP